MPMPSTQPTIVAFAGRRTDADGAAAARFPFANVRAVRAAIDESLNRIAPSLLVASAACGADLIALEAAASRGIRMRIVLPFLPPRFRATSVADRPNAEFWGRLYDDIIKGAEECGDVVVLHCSENDASASTAANKAIIGTANAASASRSTRRMPSSPGTARRTGMKIPPRSSPNWRNEAASLSFTSQRSIRSRSHIDGWKAMASCDKTCFVIMGFGKKDVVAEEREHLRADGTSDQQGDWRESR
jgi:hypothetical protein